MLKPTLWVEDVTQKALPAGTAQGGEDGDTQVWALERSVSSWTSDQTYPRIIMNIRMRSGGINPVYPG